jgi:hypothetical protein
VRTVAELIAAIKRLSPDDRAKVKAFVNSKPRDEHGMTARERQYAEAWNHHLVARGAGYVQAEYLTLIYKLFPLVLPDTFELTLANPNKNNTRIVTHAALIRFARILDSRRLERLNEVRAKTSNTNPTEIPNAKSRKSRC